MFTQQNRVWLGVIVDLLLTGLLTLVGWQPVFSFVSSQRQLAAASLGIMHTLLIPSALIAGMMHSEKIGITDERTIVDKITGAAFIAFFVMGWLMPVLAIASTPSLAWVIYPCIAAHVLPIVFALVSVIPSVGERLDRLALALSGTLGVTFLTALFCLYMAIVESFLLQLRLGPQRLAEMVFPAWAISYLPARLFLARLSGLQGIERWSFAASNIHLLVRLLLVK